MSCIFSYAQSGINTSKNSNNAKYQKVISKESIPYTNNTNKEKTQAIDTTNKLITIEGDPHPNQNTNERGKILLIVKTLNRKL